MPVNTSGNMSEYAVFTAVYASAQQPIPGLARQTARMLLVASLGLALCLAHGCGERDAGLPAVVAPQTLPDLQADHDGERLRLALADDHASPWVVRLEAIRLMRRERPAGGAELLRARALSCRNEFEQAAALDALVFAYPAQAATLVAGIMAAFHGEAQDAQRLAVILLRYRLQAGYGVAIDALVQASPSAIFSARALVLQAGPAILPALRSAHPATLGCRLVISMLIHRLEQESGAASTGLRSDGEALAQAGFPEAAVTVYAETYGLRAVPVLQQCLQSDGVQGHGEAASALADLGEEAATSEIAHLLEATPAHEVGERASYLLALGELRYAPALDALITASHDEEMIRDADQIPTWPLAQAAITGLARFPDEAAHDALIAALTRSDRPAVVLSAANALALRGDRSAAAAMLRAADALLAHGAKVESDAVISAQQRLVGQDSEQRVILAYVVRYQSPAGSYSVITDQPLLAMDAPGRVVKSAVDRALVSQESLLLSRSDISTAIQLRNSRMLSHLRLGGDALDDVDMIAR
jgi:hypothetical protein